jgi:hypothetical protein
MLALKGNNLPGVSGVKDKTATHPVSGHSFRHQTQLNQFAQRGIVLCSFAGAEVVSEKGFIPQGVLQ